MKAPLLISIGSSAWTFVNASRTTFCVPTVTCSISKLPPSTWSVLSVQIPIVVFSAAT